MKIAAQVRLKHGLLWELSQKLGSVKALAEQLGVNKMTMYGWVNLRTCPEPGVYTAAYTAEVEAKLVELAGLPIEEIFPSELKGSIKVLAENSSFVEVREVEPAALLAIAEKKSSELALPEPSEVANQAELKETMARVLQTLSIRDQQIIKCRFVEGLTLQETGRVVGLTKERVRHLEFRALRRLQALNCSAQLVDFLDDHVERKQFDIWDKEFEESQRMTLTERVNKNGGTV